MVTAEGTDRVDDLLHFTEGHAVHGYIEVIEVLTDNLVIKSVEFRIDIEQHFQKRFRISLRFLLLIGIP